MLYAHWLDGEYIRIAERLRKPGSPPISLPLGRTLKLHALFGNELVLSDVQVIDSRIILELFSDPEFRRFLKEYPPFLHLVAKPRSQGPLRFAIATSGIHRSLVPGWLSSAFGNARPVTELGRAILQARGLDPSAQLAEDAPGTIGNVVRIRWPRYGRLLEGAVWAVDHFASESSDAPVAESPVPGRPQSFYEVLQSIAGYSGLSPQHERCIEQTLKHVTTHIEDKEMRHGRSAVYTTLDTRRWPEDHQVVWHTIIHAWNCAVQSTLGADGGSLGELPFSAPVGIYLDTPTDALVPVKVEGNRIVGAPFSDKTLVSCLSWDPATVSWSEIRDALDRTSQTRERFQASLEAADSREVQEAVEEHVKALAQCFEKPVLPEIPGLLWWIAAGVAVCIGAPALGAVILGGKEIYNDVADALRRGYRYRVANTLRQSAERMTPAQRAQS